VTDSPHVAAHPSFAQALKVWARIGLTSFGGPAGQIAIMHKVLVGQKRWLDEGTFLLALNFCTLLPGPEAMQLATYSGWKLHGVRGGLAAGLLFVAPGAAVVLTIAMLYANFGNIPAIVVVFAGIKAAVLAVVVEALLRIAPRALTGGVDRAIAAAAFFAIFLFGVPFPLIVLAAATVGFRTVAVLRQETSSQADSSLPIALGATFRTLAICLAVWLLPLFTVGLSFGFDHVLTHLALFFSKLAVVTFGGAYAVLGYMAQDVVGTYGWLKPGEMLDGLGLAETTPGPLILVTEFVGFLAAARNGGQPALLFGLLGALVTLWATFAPCFLYIFVGAPYIERLKSVPRLRGALRAVTAAVVGVIFNLSLWFALHVFFRARTEVTIGALRFDLPLVSSLDFKAVGLALLAALLLFAVRAGIVTTLGISALASLILAHLF
jgi:chromate transporter